MRILAGDIGGTKTWLALFVDGAGALQCERQEKYPSRDYEGLEAMVAEFLDAGEARPDAAAFGVAGPVAGRRVATTNLPWRIDAEVLQQRFRFSQVRLLNDLEATAYGINELGAEDFAVLHAGESVPGNAAVLAAGTGLGLAAMFWDGRRHRPFPTEGGHTGFGPENEQQRALHAFMARELERVSWERVLSGSALPRLLAFVGEHEGLRPSAAVRAAMREADPGGVIANAAAQGECEACAATVALFVDLYGAHAGNVALEFLARGGVYLGGGIAPKLLPALRGAAFREAFLEKGRMRALLETIPVRVVLNERAALLGAASAGRQALDAGGPAQ